MDLKKSFTWNAFETTSTTGVIDHVFYLPVNGAKVVDGGILIFKKPLSDHHPIRMDIRLPDKSRSAK